MKKSNYFAIPLLFFLLNFANSQPAKSESPELYVFGKQGQLKMTYDARQRPNCVFIDGKVYISFNAEAPEESTGNSRTKPIAIVFDTHTKEFSQQVILGSYSKDHHYGPVIWADTENKLHIFHGWHNVLGKHLVSKKAKDIGSSLSNWVLTTAPAERMSYPWVHRIYDKKHLVFYRTWGHYSSWTYRISDDNGYTWYGPDEDAIDLDIRGGMELDWSIYTGKAVSQDGNYLHIGFIAYDDYKRKRYPSEIENDKLDKCRQFNPLYNTRVSYNYNLYYVKVDLRTHEVMNDKGEVLETPIDLTTANTKCMIWDTKWRGGSIVPNLLVDDKDNVSFLHNISDFQHPDSLDYHYVRKVDGNWKTTRITNSNHEWNCGYLSKSNDGLLLHAFLITGEGYSEQQGYMDKHGGGDIEEWISNDEGETWTFYRDLTPDRSIYPGWKFNNIQPVKDPDGQIIPGMLLFYGWKHPDNPEARAFLLVE